MLLYLDHAWEKFRAEGRMNTMKDLHDAVMEGAVSRVRPKIMAVSAILSVCCRSCGPQRCKLRRCHEAHRHANDRRRNHLGVLKSSNLSSDYVIWKKRGLKEQEEEEETPFLPPAIVPSHENRQRLLKWIALIIGLVAIFYTGDFAWHKLRPTQISARHS